MIRYDLQDSAGNVYELNGELTQNITAGTMTYLSEVFTIDNKIKQKSAGDGAVALGESRIKSRTLILNYDRVNEDTEDYKDAENELIAFLPKAVYLINVDDNTRISIRATKYSMKYSKGLHKLVGKGSITIELLTPYWESIMNNTTVKTISAGAQDDLDFTVGGYSKVQPIITIVASSLCSSLDIYLNTASPADRVGINISDPLLGSAGYETMIIDCVLGTITIGTLDRSQFIAEGTGFFTIDNGDATLVINPSGNIEVTVSYKRRFFV